MTKKRTRADELLVELGFAEDVSRARALIMAGSVMTTDPQGRERKIETAGELLAAGSTARLLGEEREYVSRSGKKLEGALEAFAIDVSGAVCADIGISTGGFTDCLLRRGAVRVHGVDVAYGLVAWKIRSDPRVVLHERTNARSLAPDVFGERVRVLVADVSFISLAVILPALVPLLEDGGAMVLLVKPQFELPREDVEGGVVDDPVKRRRAVESVAAVAVELGLVRAGDVESPLPGRDGNVEHLLYLLKRGVV